MDHSNRAYRFSITLKDLQTTADTHLTDEVKKRSEKLKIWTKDKKDGISQSMLKRTSKSWRPGITEVVHLLNLNM